jgi:ATP-dependent HslUV protease ATP-binding subunit HslU
VGRDVDSMVRDLIEISVKLVKDEEISAVKARAREAAEERVLDLLLPRPMVREPGRPIELPAQMPVEPELPTTRDKLRTWLKQGKLDERTVEVEVTEQHSPAIQIFSQAGLEEMGINLKELFGQRGSKTRRKVRVGEAIDLLQQEEASKLVDMDKVVKEAVHRAENSGIIFLDEIDKIAGREGGHGPDVSREGVQRDLLPIIEGSTVTTKYGPVRTDHVLFIAAGAFHVSKPSDLIPELQGRFPIRVELESLGSADFIRILTEPENSLTRQYAALLETEGVKLHWREDAIGEIARMAALANERMQNIGARRLHTILERLLDELSFEAPGLSGQEIQITAQYVQERLVKVLEDEDLSKYIL